MRKSAYLLALVAITIATGLAVASNDPPPPRDGTVVSETLNSSDYIPIQGRVTDANGVPLDGDYDLTFRIYDVYSGGTPLCTTLYSGHLDDGLFNAAMYAGGCHVDGRQLYLGIEVGTDGEMTPRAYIDNVPYAWSLRPGAIISGSLGSNAVLHIENWGTGGRGLRSYAMATSGENYGIVGSSRSPAGYGGYFYNNAGGTGLRAASDTGTALLAESSTGVDLRAGGTGIIQSIAPSYVWVSGSGVRPFLHGDTTDIDMNSVGGARIYLGTAGPGIRSVVLPITEAGTLYGQSGRLTSLQLTWRANTVDEKILTIRLRRQTGLCSACYVDILADTNDYTCTDESHDSGCVITNSLTTNNELGPSSGVLYLTLELNFGSDTWIDLGGARLSVIYDE